MTKKSELGKLGEDIACDYLIKNNYKIMGRNIKKPWGEIDIIAKAPDKTIVFVEVKTVHKAKEGIVPEDQMTKAKILKTQKMATYYAQENPKIINEDRGWRIDVLAISIEERGLKIRHYENI